MMRRKSHRAGGWRLCGAPAIVSLLAAAAAALQAQPTCSYIGQFRIGPTSLGTDYTLDAAGINNLAVQVATERTCAVNLDGVPEWVAFGELINTTETVTIGNQTISNARNILFEAGLVRENRTGQTRRAVLRAGSLSLTLRQWKNVTALSSASYLQGPVAAGSLASLFGLNLSAASEIAAGDPLPVQLAGTRITLRTTDGREFAAPLIAVSPGQVNFLVPSDIPPGPVRLSVTGADGDTGTQALSIAAVAPGLFTFNGNGHGAPAGHLIRLVDGQQTQEIEQIYRQSDTGEFIPAEIDLGPESHRVFLALFGTGFRAHSGMERVTVRVGSVDVPIVYAGAQGDFAGLDQLNVELPRFLIGAGEVNLVLTVDGLASNPVRLSIR